MHRVWGHAVRVWALVGHRVRCLPARAMSLIDKGRGWGQQQGWGGRDACTKPCASPNPCSHIGGQVCEQLQLLLSLQHVPLQSRALGLKELVLQAQGLHNVGQMEHAPVRVECIKPPNSQPHTGWCCETYG